MYGYSFSCKVTLISGKLKKAARDGIDLGHSVYVFVEHKSLHILFTVRDRMLLQSQTLNVPVQPESPRWMQRQCVVVAIRNVFQIFSVDLNAVILRSERVWTWRAQLQCGCSHWYCHFFLNQTEPGITKGVKARRSCYCFPFALLVLLTVRSVANWYSCWLIGRVSAVTTHDAHRLRCGAAAHTLHAWVLDSNITSNWIDMISIKIM